MDPEQVRRFAEELKRFNTDLQDKITSLQARFAALGDTWQARSTPSSWRSSSRPSRR